jgi:O-antigen/teichoic acid export membrane protein
MSKRRSEPAQLAPPETSGPLAADAPRIDSGITDLRGHTARGTIVTSAFLIGLSALGALEKVAAAAFLTRAEFGLWAVILTILVTLAWLKQLGIMDKYIQQSEDDQEAAFQKAFTLELVVSLGFFVVVAIALPLYALAYGHPEIIVPGLVCALSVPITAFETPAWIPYRQLRYARQRLLMSVNPVVTFVVVVALGAAGAGYWCFVIGILVGSIAGAGVCGLTSPYRFRLRLDRPTVRAYTSFSWPLFGAGLSRLLIVQGTLLVANAEVGLAGIGAIGLAVAIATFAERVDAIVSQTIYPAVCAVTDRTELMFETFVKSNRVALMWAIPFGAGLALFADDLVRFVLGDQWEPAAGLIAAIGLAIAVGQVAFNWHVFMRAVDDTRPLFYATLLDLLVFAAVSVPLILEFGLTGYAASFAVATVVQIAARGWFLRRLFAGFNVGRQLVRAVLPALPAPAVVLLVRQLESGDRTLALALGEVLLYALVAVASTLLLERRLIRELVGYLRRGSRRVSAPAARPVPSGRGSPG